MLILNIIYTFSSVSIVDFKQVNVSRVAILFSKKTTEKCDQLFYFIVT